jgi:hypothetical protein
MLRRNFIFQITILLNWKKENLTTPDVIQTLFTKGRYELYVPQKFLGKYIFADGEQVLYRDEIILQLDLPNQPVITEMIFNSYTSCLKYLSNMDREQR